MTDGRRSDGLGESGGMGREVMGFGLTGRNDGNVESDDGTRIIKLK